MMEWTTEEIAKLTHEAVKSLRENAAKRGKQDIVARCDADLVRRNPPRARPVRPGASAETRAGHYVSEFHFVCPGELGVTRNQDGTIWSGTWVVAVANAKDGEKYGSLVALHATRTDPSYLQGTIKAWLKKPRERKYAEGQEVRTKFGIDFLFEPSSNPLPWQGDATGEKGYAWAPIPAKTQQLTGRRVRTTFNHSHSMVPGGFDVTS